MGTVPSFNCLFTPEIYDTYSFRLLLLISHTHLRPLPKGKTRPPDSVRCPPKVGSLFVHSGHVSLST